MRKRLLWLFFCSAGFCLASLSAQASPPASSSPPAPSWQSVDELLRKLETEATLSAAESMQLAERLRLASSMLTASQTEVTELSLSLERLKQSLQLSETERLRAQSRSRILGWTTGIASVAAAILAAIIILR